MNKFKKAFSLIELSIVILVIGILIAGTFQGISLLSKMRVAVATNMTKNSPVASVKNLVLWYEATSAESFSSSLDIHSSKEEMISIWNDINPQSQFKIDAIQNTDNNKPFLKKRAINGLPAISFKGDDFLSVDNNVSYIVKGNVVMSFFVVFDSNYTSNSEVRLLNFNSGTYHFLTARISSNSISMYAYTSSSGYKLSPVLLSSMTSYGPKVLYVTMKNDKISSYVNGEAKIVNQSYAPGNFNFSSLTIGSGINTSGATQFFPGEIGEIIFFNRVLKGAEREDIEKYLITKWKIEV